MKRYTVIDIFRGISVICMIVYHTLWDLVYSFGADISFFNTQFASVFQGYIRWSFILISGFCWSLGKRKLKRGVTVFLASAILTLFTRFFMPENIIKYGVLTLLGTAMLITVPLDRFLKKVPAAVGFLCSALLFVLTFGVKEKKLGIFNIFYITLPSSLYANEFSAFLGFPPKNFYSSDYVPVLPWIFLFFAGYFLFYIFKKKKLLSALSAFSIKPLEWVGRHALIIYILHQPVIYCLLFVLFSYVL